MTTQHVLKVMQAMLEQLCQQETGKDEWRITTCSICGRPSWDHHVTCGVTELRTLLGEIE